MNLLDLPNEVLIEIINWSGISCYYSLSCVCRRLNYVCCGSQFTEAVNNKISRLTGVRGGATDDLLGLLINLHNTYYAIDRSLAYLNEVMPTEPVNEVPQAVLDACETILKYRLQALVVLKYFEQFPKDLYQYALAVWFSRIIIQLEGQRLIRDPDNSSIEKAFGVYMAEECKLIPIYPGDTSPSVETLAHWAFNVPFKNIDMPHIKSMVRCALFVKEAERFKIKARFVTFHCTFVYVEIDINGETMFLDLLRKVGFRTLRDLRELYVYVMQSVEDNVHDTQYPLFIEGLDVFKLVSLAYGVEMGSMDSFIKLLVDKPSFELAMYPNLHERILDPAPEYAARLTFSKFGAIIFYESKYAVCVASQRRPGTFLNCLDSSGRWFWVLDLNLQAASGVKTKTIGEVVVPDIGVDLAAVGQYFRYYDRQISRFSDDIPAGHTPVKQSIGGFNQFLDNC